MKNKGKLKKRLIIFAVITVLTVLFCSWQNSMLTVTEYTYKSDKISEGFTIVQISDLHNKNYGEKQKRLIEKISALEPDLIVITGDIADSRRTNIPKAIEFAEEAAKITDTYYVTGNHEQHLDRGRFDWMMNGLKHTGTIRLVSESVDISINGDNFRLTGFDDNSLVDIENRCPKLSGDKLNVVLAHEPQLIEEYSTHGNVDLVLTGHAHGGQFILPFIGGVYAPGQGVNPEYTEGMHKMGDTTMIVSRGVGNSAFPLRLFNYPEIVKVTIENEKADN